MKLSPAEIQQGLDRVRNNNFRQFVKRIRLQNIRGFTDETVEFKAPVTALVGTNGGGKSTILGSAALAYKLSGQANFFQKLSWAMKACRIGA